MRQIGNATLYHGDSREVLKSLPPASVDACVTDPPYNLTSIRKRFGAENAAPAKDRDGSGPYTRTSRGFMGKQWDTGEVTEDPAFWAEVLRVLKPGAHILAMGGTRTYHRLVMAIEDAGFEIRDTICWHYGQGFPKSHNLSKQFNELAHSAKDMDEIAHYALLSQEYAGYSTALKPATELICLARKPILGTVRENVERFGTGALNIDVCRIPLNGETWDGNEDNAHEDYSGKVFGKFGKQYAKPAHSQGRWPANVILDESAAAELDRQSGVLSTHSSGKHSLGEYRNGGIFNGYGEGGERHIEPDFGGASRFFYVAKADRSEREQGCEELPAQSNADWPQSLDGNDKRGASPRGNIHPTCKPLTLMSYLIRLITPPCGMVLDPFMGSGTTGVSCLRETYRFIGIEKEDDYFSISLAKVTDAANLVGLFAEELTP